MAKIRFCNLCDRNVAATKKFSWAIFLFSALTVIGPILYLLWYFVRPRTLCPICGNNDLMSSSTKAELIKADKETSTE